MTKVLGRKDGSTQGMPSAKMATLKERSAEPVQKVTTEFEFGGPLGATAVMISLPLVIVGLYAGCGRNGCASGLASAAAMFKSMQIPQLWDWTAAAVVFGWTALHFALYVLLPGPRVEGVVLRDGSRLKYPINGHLALWVSLTACVHGLPQLGMSLSWLYDHYLQLAIASCALSTVISLYSYAVSFADGCMLAEGGNSRNPVYDFFIGRPLNPRLGLLDLKACCELRPGLIGWAVINLGMACKQFECTGAVTPSMLLVNAFQLVYVWDALYNEQSILTTMDITTDGFGFMLAFGDLAWVPFTYSLQARILVDHDPSLSMSALIGVALLNILGYCVFRGANSQKDAFRRDPAGEDVRHLQWMQTKRGSKLLVSGWWGMARKINYTGDWMMGLAWSLTCGASTPIAYFYPIYFAVLLMHRAWRDDHFCSIKYGADWAEYKQRVPFVFIPGIL